VLHSIPSGRKQKKIPAALKEVSALLTKYNYIINFNNERIIPYFSCLLYNGLGLGFTQAGT